MKFDLEAVSPCRRAEKDLKMNTDISLLVLTLLFLEVYSFPQASLSENGLLLSTERVANRI